MDDTKLRVLTEMIHDRGYDSVEKNNVDNEMEIYHVYKDGVLVIVIFVIEPKLCTNDIKTCVEYLDNIKVKNTIILCCNGTTPKSKSIVEGLVNTGDYYIEVFDISWFSYNRTKHRLVPKHTRLSDCDAKTIMNKYGKIPDILISDPIARYYGYKIRDVIKVTRNDGGICYRMVSNNT